MRTSSSLVLALSLAALAHGCSYSRFTAPHQPYTPLLDHRGQLDVAASVGGMEQMQTTASARVAYAPTDNLSIVGGYDGDFWTEAGNPTQHHGGALGIGTFVRDPILRLEAMLVLGAGYGWGDSVSNTGSSSTSYRTEGGYFQPGVQFAVGFEIPYFEMAGGVRLMTNLADIHYVETGGSGSTGSSGQVGSNALMVDHFLTLRLPIDSFRIETTVGWAGVFFGSAPFASELPSRFYATGGIAFQFDTQNVPPYDAEPTVDESTDL